MEQYEKLLKYLLIMIVNYFIWNFFIEFLLNLAKEKTLFLSYYLVSI